MKPRVSQETIDCVNQELDNDEDYQYWIDVLEQQADADVGEDVAAMAWAEGG